MSFYGAAKKQNPNTADFDKDNTFVFYANCLQQNITPCPIISKIEEKILSLLAYPISRQMAEVLGRDLQFSK
jgi:hypothetical protein